MHILSFYGRKHILGFNLLNELYFLGLQFLLCEVRHHLNVPTPFKYVGRMCLRLADKANVP